jgi:hypothetical protein
MFSSHLRDFSQKLTTLNIRGTFSAFKYGENSSTPLLATDNQRSGAVIGRASKVPHDPEGDDHPGFDIPPAWSGYVRSPAEECKYWFIRHRHIARFANDIYLSADRAALGMPKLN